MDEDDTPRRMATQPVSEQRDPNDINAYIKNSFDDVIAEPDDSHSFDCVWRNSTDCYNACQGCCYKLMTALCGMCIAGCWGFEFAMITFCHVWYITPVLRVFTIFAACTQKFLGTIANCCVAPFCEACGICFSSISIRKHG